MGEGPGSVEDHVILQPNDFKTVGEANWQEQELIETCSPHNYGPTCARTARRSAGARTHTPRPSAAAAELEAPLPQPQPPPRLPRGRSRLAACIFLTKEMDGITALVPRDNVDTTGLIVRAPPLHAPSLPSGATLAPGRRETTD